MAFTLGDKIPCPENTWTLITDVASIIQFNLPWNIKCFYLETTDDLTTVRNTYPTPNLDTDPILELSDGRNPNRNNFFLREYKNDFGPLYVFPAKDISCQIGV